MTGKKSKKSSQKKMLEKEIRKIFNQHKHTPLNYKQLAKKLNVKAQSVKILIPVILDEMTSSGKLEEVYTGKFKMKKIQRGIIVGTVDLTASGSAYVVSDDIKEDVYVSSKNISNALHRDTVKVLLSNKRKRRKPEGKIVEIINRAKDDFVGTIEISKSFAFLIPDDHKMHVDIYIPLGSLKGAENGEKAIARITDWAEGAANPVGEIIEVLGSPGDHTVEMRSILAEHGLSLSFPKEVETAASNIPVKIPAEEIAKRRDFRKTITFTIDPADAKDFDDAISVSKLKNGNIEVGVHIADVTHYVKTGGVIDKEAQKRATSIYLVDRVIPMLPEVLSNNLCSLRPGEEKLCFSVVFELNNEGIIIEKWIGKTIILSDKRFTYEDVQEVFDKPQSQPMLPKKSNKHDRILSEYSLLLNKLAKIIRKRRIQHGAIAFDKIELKFHLDDEGNPAGVLFKEQNDSHRLIEEFMLLANRSVAELTGKGQAGKNMPAGHAGKPLKPFVYRIHETPDPLKISSLKSFVSQFGYKLSTKDPASIAGSMNRMLTAVKGKREENMIELLAIRTMAKASYSTDNIGHYGLAFGHYTHFTSPIRRYPDMMVHRLLFNYLNGEKSTETEVIEKQCKHCSEMERKAVDAERDSVKFFQVLFLKDRVGEEFEGIVSGVNEWGMFVELVDNMCEGMVRMKDIDDGDYYVLDEKNHLLKGHNFGKTFQLGDKVMIKINKADLAKRRLDFVLANEA